MCGIAGVAHLDGRNAEAWRLEAMAGAMAHRGPDAQGVFGAGTSVGLVHRRLAIIDLSTGYQPMTTVDGSLVVVFNGEIYNFDEVRTTLLQEGHRFRTSSDTEVLLHAYREWGTAMLARLNGMFAFALYDLKNQKLFIARDRLGVKPLYYFFSGQTFVFASEMQALLESGLVPGTIDRTALDLYLHYQYIPAPLTIYRQVKKLPPAGCMVLDVHSGNLDVREYWQLPVGVGTLEEGKRDMRDWLDELGALVEDAVSIRLVSDVPFGAFLSGGTDSGLVVALMAKKMGRAVQTFSIGISGQGQTDELPFARQVARQYGTEHEEFQVSPSDLALIPTLSRFFGEPFADSSAIPTYLVSQLAASRVKMVLTGDGGDELFAGYLTYSHLMRALDPSSRSHPEGLLAWVLHQLANRMPGPYARARGLYHMLSGQGGEPPPRNMEPWKYWYDNSMCHFTYAERRKLLCDQSEAISTEDFFLRKYPYPDADDVIAQVQFCDFKSYLPGDILVKLDRMSMANSIEARSPLLDYRIAELAFRIPLRFKIAEPLPDGVKNKFILKELAAGYLGKEYVYRKKEGFGIPIGRWLREDRTGIVRDMLMQSGSPLFEHLDRSTVQSIVKAHLAGKKNLGAKVWNFLMLNAWLEEVHANRG